MIFMLSACALITSIISGIAGMAGGVLLLSLMTFLLEIRLIVPIHGVVQLVSNSSRCWLLRQHARMDFFIPYAMGAPFGFVAAYFILKNISNTHYLYLFVALLIFWALFKPKNLPEVRLASYQWGILGVFAGLQSALVGATGPMVAIFYIRSDLKKEQIVSTKALQQLFTHLLKIPLFLSLQFNYLENLNLIIAMSVMTVAGTAVGVQILKKVNEKVFKIIFKSLLFLAAMRMLYKFFEVL